MLLHILTVVFSLSVVCGAEWRENEVTDADCARLNCVGEEYECMNGRCYCADGYIPNHLQYSCVRCPDVGEKCFGMCCDRRGNDSVRCWQGVCQVCYDLNGNWICRDSMGQVLLVTTTQMVMGVALVLGIIATFILLYKLCAATDLRSLSNRSQVEGRLSIGSLQIYVNERLRDAPPRYARTNRTPAPEAVVYPSATYINSGFIHDSTVPPPAYTEIIKTEDNQVPTLHI